MHSFLKKTLSLSLTLSLLAGAASLGSVGISYWAVARVTDGRDRLRLDRLAPAQR